MCKNMEVFRKKCFKKGHDVDNKFLFHSIVVGSEFIAIVCSANVALNSCNIFQAMHV